MASGLAYSVQDLARRVADSYPSAVYALDESPPPDGGERNVIGEAGGWARRLQL